MEFSSTGLPTAAGAAQGRFRPTGRQRAANRIASVTAEYADWPKPGRTPVVGRPIPANGTFVNDQKRGMRRFSQRNPLRKLAAYNLIL